MPELKRGGMMPRTILPLSFILIALLLSCNTDKFAKEPSKLTDEELYGILEEAEGRDLAPYWLEAEKREMIFVKSIAHDKSGPVVKLFIDERLSQNAVARYILFKLRDPSKLSYAEKGVFFYQSACYQLQEAVPLILKALEGEVSLNPHIAAAYAFGRLRNEKAKPWLKKNLDAEYRETLGSGSPFDGSKRDELLKASKEALEALKEE
jgi:hypothetical protein